MMRRGPLSEYPLDTVLRSAAREKLSGSVTIERSAPVGTIYLVGGRISGAVVEGVDTGPLGNGAEPTLATVQRHIESVVALLAGIDDGWYHHDPIDTGSVDMGWRVDVSVVLEAAERRRREAEPLLRWVGAPIRLEAPESAPDLGADAWQVIVAMTPGVNLHDIHGRMGWDTRRLAAAMEELEASGLLVGSARPRPGQPAAADEAVEAARASDGQDEDHGWEGPVTVEKKALSRPTWSSTTAPEEGDPETPGRTTPSKQFPAEREPSPSAGPRWAGAPASASVAGGDGPTDEAKQAAGDTDDGAPTGRRSALKRLIASLRT